MESPSVTKVKSTNLEAHPFGGCNKLLNHYACIGSELIKYEVTAGRYGYGTLSALKHFREGVVFVPLEVLESYLEDLLDIEVSETRLFITSNGSSRSWLFLCILGLMTAIAVGLYAASSGASIWRSFGLTLLIALPFWVVWHLAPKDGVARRLGFAQVVSHEVARRRGLDKGPRESIRDKFIFPEFLAQKTPGSARASFN